MFQIYFQLLIHRRRRPGCYKYIANVVRHFSRKTKPSRNFINKIDKSGSKMLNTLISCFFLYLFIVFSRFPPLPDTFPIKSFLLSLRAIQYTTPYQEYISTFRSEQVPSLQCLYLITMTNSKLQDGVTYWPLFKQILNDATLAEMLHTKYYLIKTVPSFYFPQD